MSTLEVQVDGLGKRYRLGASRPRYGSLRESLSLAAARPFRRSDPGKPSAEVWALRDVSLELEHGEVVGIVGPNGAGKSTLLKILSRITRPTVGQARVRGRLGSLLEVGTGFHPELTGRENVYLSGAILGMKRSDIARKFDEIVSFAGTESHLDTPVKRYSTGMYMRLAFAVAAHLEPDVLIVDEVLAVGDAEFQKKCLGRMTEVAGEGRTVLFVSHDQVAVEGLCNRALLLDKGRLLFDGSPRETLDVYRSRFQLATASTDLAHASGRISNMKPVLKRIELRDGHGRSTTSVECGEPLVIELWYEHTSDLQAPVFAILAKTTSGLRVFHLPSEVTGELPGRAPRSGRAECTINTLPLVPGRYSLTLGCRSGVEQLDLVEDACYLEVIPGNFYGTGRLPSASNGPVLVRGAWAIRDT
jgi:lipopolysaccharide transport system ATP-binding protein